MLKTAKQVCRIELRSQRTRVVQHQSLDCFHLKKHTLINAQKKLLLDFTTQKIEEPKLLWIPQKSSYHLRHFNSRLPSPRQIKNEMTAFKGIMSSSSS